MYEPTYRNQNFILIAYNFRNIEIISIENIHDITNSFKQLSEFITNNSLIMHFKGKTLKKLNLSTNFKLSSIKKYRTLNQLFIYGRGEISLNIIDHSFVLRIR